LEAATVADKEEVGMETVVILVGIVAKEEG